MRSTLLLCIATAISAADAPAPAPAKDQPTLAVPPREVMERDPVVRSVTADDLGNFVYCTRHLLSDLTLKPEQIAALAVSIKHAEDEMASMRAAEAAAKEAAAKAAEKPAEKK